jgi:AmmeMemoRadiSam system protein A
MERRQLLPSIARKAIEEAFGGPKVVPPSGAPWLDEERAVFVTLLKRGQLRGCIGQLAAQQPLFHAVCGAARSAAFEDPRFPPVRHAELTSIHIEISVLSPIEPLDVRSETEALAAIRPGVDGLVLRHGRRSGVFIPEVWKQLPEAREFLKHLKHKAGLPTDEWLEGTQVERFTAELFLEGTPEAST